jgi:hypothetical protein
MRTSLFLAAEALAAASMLGCGGSEPGFLAGPSQPSGPSSDGDGAISSDNTDATTARDNTDAEVFAPPDIGDAGAVVTQGACAPGVYQGSFMTYTAPGGDGGSPGIFSFMWNGNLTIDLSAQKITMTSTTVGELPTTTSSSTLEIADGGMLDGSDMLGGTFFADLSGKLDCSPDAGQPYHFTATFGNARYDSFFIKIPLIGNLTADYQEAGAGAPPMLINGSMLVAGLLMPGGQPFASASGTWSATWVSGP